MYWKPLVQKYSIVFSYKYFIGSFVNPVINRLTSSYQPRISLEIKMVLKFEKKGKVGDYYLY